MDIKQFCILKNATVRESIKAIDANGKKVVFIVEEDLTLLGIFTDGDMRRYVLRNGDLNEPVSTAMNDKPVVFQDGDETGLRNFMNDNKMLVYPIVNEVGKIVRAMFWDEEDSISAADALPEGIQVVIQAGGKGTRLYPYTKILPKPLIPIGEIPIVEHIIDRFRRYACRDFYMVVNYKKNMIKAYFNEIEKDYRLNYVEEEKFLGTGGGIKLLGNRINQTFFLSNCDILIDANYSSIYRFHKKQGNRITIVGAMKHVVVPYGVLKLDDEGRIAELSEKPEYSFLTNTGLYILEPEVLDAIEPDVPIHITDIISNFMKEGEKVGVYPISERQWLDMGQIEELDNMIKAIGDR
jgi:dTDP-glucose pyrophosphorylase